MIQQAALSLLATYGLHYTFPFLSFINLLMVVKALHKAAIIWMITNDGVAAQTNKNYRKYFNILS